MKHADLVNSRDEPWQMVCPIAQLYITACRSITIRTFCVALINEMFSSLYIKYTFDDLLSLLHRVFKLN